MNLPSDASTDQENVPENYYRRSNGMLHQLPDEPVASAGETCQEVEKDFLLDMSRDELETLAWRLLCQHGLAATMTAEETAQAMLDTLAETALKPIKIGVNMRADIQSRMAAIDKWLDRTQGKAVQRIDQRVQSVHTMVASEMTTAQILEQLGKLELPANVKLIEGRVEVVDTTGGS